MLKLALFVSPGLPKGAMVAGHSFHYNEKRMMIVGPSLNLPLQAKREDGRLHPTSREDWCAGTIGAKKVGDRAPYPAVDPVIVSAGSQESR